MENQMNVVEWIKENKDMWNLICGVNGDPDSEQLQKLYNCLYAKVQETEEFSILFLTLLTRYGKKLFPEETGTAEELAFNRYLYAVKESGK